MENIYLYLPAILAVVGLIFMAVKFYWVKKQDPGDARMQSISKSIKDGALAFLAAEYRLLLIFVVIAAIALFFVSTLVDTTHWIIVVAFIVGAIFSALAGNIGLQMPTPEQLRRLKPPYRRH